MLELLDGFDTSLRLLLLHKEPWPERLFGWCHRFKGLHDSTVAHYLELRRQLLLFLKEWDSNAAVLDGHTAIAWARKDTAGTGQRGPQHSGRL